MTFRLGLLLVAGCVPVLTRADSPYNALPTGLPFPGYPHDAVARHLEGTVLLYIKFGDDGHVVDCRVQHSSGHAILDDSTRDFILKNWKGKEFANRSGSVPFVYRLSDSALERALSSDRAQFPFPDYPAEALAKKTQGTVGFFVVFGKDGAVEMCKVTKSSGSLLLDTHTRDFILKHWKSKEYAGQSAPDEINYAISST